MEFRQETGVGAVSVPNVVPACRHGARPAPSGKGGRVPRPRFAAGGLDRMSPARQRLGKQVRSIVERNAPFQTRDRGRGPHCRVPTRATRHAICLVRCPFLLGRACFGGGRRPRSRNSARGAAWAGSLLGYTISKFRPCARDLTKAHVLHNKRQQNENNCRSVRASQQSVTLAKLMRTSALPSQPLDHPANMSLKQLINALTSRGFRQTHWRGEGSKGGKSRQTHPETLAMSTMLVFSN